MCIHHEVGARGGQVELGEENIGRGEKRRREGEVGGKRRGYKEENRLLCEKFICVKLSLFRRAFRNSNSSTFGVYFGLTSV